MRIRREFIPSADNFTIIPNDWARDPNLSRRAVGLLVELLSHREGWEVTVESLWRGGTEGKSTVTSTIKELEDAGYLERRQERNGNRFGAMEYVLMDPATGSAGDRDSGARLTGTGTEVSDASVAEASLTVNAPTKKTIQEDQPRRPTKNTKERTIVAPTAGDSFAEFWAIYPRRQARAAAAKAWPKAIKRADVATILAAATAYRDDPNRDAAFTAHAATWLNQERWEDEPLPSTSRQTSGGGYDPADWMGRPSAHSFIDGQVVEQMEIGR